MTVVTAGIWDASTSFVISLWAREIFTPPPSSNSLDAIAIVIMTNEIVRFRRFVVEKKIYSSTVRRHPMAAPRIMMIGMEGMQ